MRVWISPNTMFLALSCFCGIMDLSDGKRFVVRYDEKLTAFIAKGDTRVRGELCARMRSPKMNHCWLLELESAIRILR